MMKPTQKNLPGPQRLSKSGRNSLSQARSYREFLKTYFQETGLSYAEVSRRAGFSSRSYPRDVTENRRRLTSKAMPALIRGMRLDASLSKLFQALYYSEFPEEHLGQLTQREIGAWVKRERSRTLKGPVRVDVNMSQVLRVGFRQETPVSALTEVVAALGEPGVGATLEEIRQRTGLTKESLVPILGLLEKEGLLEYSANTCHYLPRSGHLNLTGFPQNELAKAVFLSSLRKLEQVADKHFSQEDALFMTSAVSVKKADLPRLKKEMRELILRFIDRNVEDSEQPDTVIHLVNSIFEAPLVRK